MEHADITGLSATDLARRIAGGEVSSHEVVKAHIERIEAVNGALNAVVVPRFEQALREAREADVKRLRGEHLPPLHGVPVTIKECLDLTGTPSTFGLPSRASHRAAQDNSHVAQLRSKGAIILGKTNVAQCLLYYESDNPVYGRSNNPWDKTRTPGGSSGGEGAIIAAGGSPLGLGTDIGGSVRIPAAFCGITSLKPTSGRLPDMGRLSVPLGQRAIPSQIGVLARHVEDVALALRLLNEGVTSPPVALGNYLTVDLHNLRIGYYTQDSCFEAGDAAGRAVLQAVNLLREAGARMVEFRPPEVPLALQLFLSIFSADGGAGLKQMLGRDKRTPQMRTLLMAVSRSRPTLALMRQMLRLAGQEGMATGLKAFGRHDTHHYWQLVEAQLDYQERFAAALNGSRSDPIDVLIGPPSALPAFTHGASRDLMTAGAYCPLYNLLGYPAGVVPLTRVREKEQNNRVPSSDRIMTLARKVEQNSAGLPVGVQVIARPWQEHVALAVMRALEMTARNHSEYPRTPIAPR